MSKVISLLILGAVAYYWWHSQRIKEMAFRACARRCREAGVQLLDHSVAQSRLWLTRDARGQWCFGRCYRFEFATNGEERYHGNVEVIGRQIQRIEMDAFPIN